MLKPSIFNFYLKKSDTIHIIFNSFTGALVSVDEKEMNLIQKSILDELDLNTRESLIHNGILINADFDEQSAVWMKRNRYLLSERKHFISVIAPTTECNARCTYCYEKGIIPLKMTENIINQTIEYIKENIVKCNSATIVWFGGEPLLCKNEIEAISSELIEFAKEHDIKYNSFMYTNSSLIDEYTIEKLNSWHINHVQICLDGFGNTHNARKNYYNYPDAYKKTLQTVRVLLQAGIKITLRLNIDVNNVNSVIELIPDIFETVEPSENLEILPVLLNYEDGHPNIMSETEIKQKFTTIINLLYNFGFISEIASLIPKNNNCYATLPSSVVIGPSGRLFKCQQLLENDSAVIGDVWNGVIFNKTFYDWCSTDFPKSCDGCKYLPLCLGGCTAHQKDSKKQQTICIGQKYYTDALINILYNLRTRQI